MKIEIQAEDRPYSGPPLRWQKISKCTWFSMLERSPTAATCAANQPPVLPNWKDTCWFIETNPAWLCDFLRYEIEKGLRAVCFTVGRSLLFTHSVTCTTACHLKIHNQIHLGEMSFNCRQCNYACTTAVNLKRHMLTHSRAKPFGCSQCNNTFTTVQKL